MRIKRVTRWQTATAIGVAIWVGIGLAALGGCTAAPPSPTNTVKTLPGCTAEDSSEVYPCVWDATLHGNGEGRSFVRYNSEHVEWTDDIRERPDLYRETCQVSQRQVTCWSK